MPKKGSQGVYSVKFAQVDQFSPRWAHFAFEPHCQEAGHSTEKSSNGVLSIKFLYSEPILMVLVAFDLRGGQTEEHN
jgi:hypothetical protein